MFGRKTCPIKDVKDYLISKHTAASKILPLLEIPKIEEERQKVELYKAEIHLKAKREEYKLKRKCLDDDWEQIAKEQEVLKKNFEKFNEFVIENLDKRIRVSECLGSYKQLVIQRENSIKELRTKINKTRQHLIELQEGVCSHKVYEKFLNTVVDASVLREENFKNADSIIERYEFHVELGAKLAEKQAEEFMIIQNAKMQLSKFYEDNQNRILGLHTDVSSFQQRYEDAIRKTRELENLICHIKDKIRYNYSDAKTTKAAIWNLYKIVCHKKRITPKIHKDDCEQQLIFISKIILQYEYLNKELAKLVNNPSVIKQSKKK